MRRIAQAFAMASAALSCLGAEPLRVRVESFTVMPSTGPVVHATVRNESEQPVKASFGVRWPDGWTAEPDEQHLELAPNETVRAPFTLTQAVDVAANRYSLGLVMRVGGRELLGSQQTVCATAPYLRPEIDGKLDDWKDAVPIWLLHDRKRTTMMTCWDRRRICVAVRVEEESLQKWDRRGEAAAVDAIQFSLAASPPPPGDRETNADRYEFVVVPVSIRRRTAEAFLLMQPGDKTAQAADVRELDGLDCRDVEARVRRKSGTTCYEVAIPIVCLPGIRPTTGRTFRFSLLVHDGASGALVDFGVMLDRWEDERDPLAWCRWKGASFGDVVPFAGNVEFGFSSSIH